MPLPTGTTLPEEKSYPVVPADCWEVVIEDIISETKPSVFTKPDGTPQDPQTQYKVTLKITDAGEQVDRLLFAWIRPSLQASTKSKRPTLAQFLLAVTGKSFGPEDKDQVTGEFLNSVIGSRLRVTTQVEKAKTSDTLYAVVAAFLPTKVPKV